MRPSTLLLTALLAAASAAGGARAATSDAPVSSSAAAVTAGDEVDRQIDAWVSQSSLSPNDLATPAAQPDAPRQIHGQVSVGFGNHGYREFAGVAEIPFARTGVATVAVRDVQGDGYGYGYGYGHQHLQSIALGISLGDAARGRGRPSLCGDTRGYDSPLWARRMWADGYGDSAACEVERTVDHY